MPNVYHRDGSLKETVKAKASVQGQIMRYSIVALCSLVLPMPAYSGTDVIDFEQLPRDLTVTESPYAEDGYIVERVADPRCASSTLSFRYQTYPTGENVRMVTPVWPMPTCTEYVQFSSRVVVRRPYSQTFNARAIDLSCGPYGSCFETLRARGIAADGQIHEQSCPAQIGALVTCGLDARFTDLISLELDEFMRAIPVFYDNIVLENGSTLPTPWAEVAPRTLDFGQAVVGGTNGLTVAVRNRGTAPLSVTSVGQTDPIVAPFSIAQNNCTGVTLQPGTACAFTVNFSPTVAAEYTDSLTVVSNDAYASITKVNVRGVGVTIAGQIFGLRQLSVTCSNKKRKSSVTFLLSAEEMGSWDCQTSGMVVASGDEITMTIKGLAE